jgi:hypothetical protein
VFFDGWPKHGQQWQDQQDNHRDQQNRAGETDGICCYAVQCRRYRVRADTNARASRPFGASSGTVP